ncbi:MAG: hypothetical protein QF922_03645, partial [SAR324 cluster bacterium]|nr:hypothetical protein [SAR324 cluster bacterium]
FKYLILILFLMKLGVSSEQGSPKNRASGLVAGHQSLICGELHHPSGLQGKRFVRFRIGFSGHPLLGEFDSAVIQGDGFDLGAAQIHANAHVLQKVEVVNQPSIS